MDKKFTLQEFGLTPKEAAVYITLLETGKVSAYTVAKKSGLKKPTAYVILESLIEKGLAFKVPREKKQLYLAQSPEILRKRAQERLWHMEHILPELLSLAQSHQSSVRTLFFEGLPGVRQAYWHRMKELENTEFVGFYGAAQEIGKPLLDVMHEWNLTNRDLHIRSRAIVPKHPSLAQFRRLDKRHFRAVKIVPMEAYTSHMSMEITDLFVRVTMFREMQCVILDNPSLAKTFRQIFEMLWRALPQKPSGYLPE